jgi:hypothetical protein
MLMATATLVLCLVQIVHASMHRPATTMTCHDTISITPSPTTSAMLCITSISCSMLSVSHGVFNSIGVYALVYFD